MDQIKTVAHPYLQKNPGMTAFAQCVDECLPAEIFGTIQSSPILPAFHTPPPRGVVDVHVATAVSFKMHKHSFIHCISLTFLEANLELV